MSFAFRPRTALRDPTVAKRLMLFSVVLSPTSPRLSADAYCCMLADPIWAQLMHATATGTLHTKGNIRYSIVIESLDGFWLRAKNFLSMFQRHFTNSANLLRICWHRRQSWMSSDRITAIESRSDFKQYSLAFFVPIRSTGPSFWWHWIDVYL